MKNNKVVFVFLVMLIVAIIIAILCLVLVLNRKNSNNQNSIYDDINVNGKNTSISNDENTIKSKYTEYTFDTAYGKVKIEADKALSARGTAGASNNIFYLKDSNLYLSMDNTGVDKKYASGVEDIYYEDEKSEYIIVKLNSNYEIIKESPYLEYIK